MEIIKRAENLVGDNFIGVFDREYDDNKIIHYMSRHKIVIKLEDKRNLIFKGKRHSVEEISKGRKGKIKMKALFDDNEEKELIISYTKTKFSYYKKEYTLVIVYGLSEDHSMKLLTNIEYAEKEDAIKIVRLYLSRWRIEEHFRGKKQEYDFENMRVKINDLQYT